MERNDSCNFEGRTYKSDSEVCTADKCMICNFGEWKDINPYLVALNYPDFLS